MFGPKDEEGSKGRIEKATVRLFPAPKFCARPTCAAWNASRSMPRQAEPEPYRSRPTASRDDRNLSPIIPDYTASALKRLGL